MSQVGETPADHLSGNLFVLRVTAIGPFQMGLEVDENGMFSKIFSLIICGWMVCFKAPCNNPLSVLRAG